MIMARVGTSVSNEDENREEERKRGIICQAFADAARHTWVDLRDLSDLGEESITDYRILDWKRSCSRNVHIRKFNKAAEGGSKYTEGTGADWEWWLGSGDDWFGMRVQAKKLKDGRYDNLARCVGKTKVRQIDQLLKATREAEKKGIFVYPMYCFYNHWDSTSFPTLDWPCKTFKESDEAWGATVADAYEIKQLIDTKMTDLLSVGSISRPLRCLACCVGKKPLSPTSPLTLPYRAQSIAIMLRERWSKKQEPLRGRGRKPTILPVPTVTKNPPSYVLSILDSEKEDEELISGDYGNHLSRLKGVIVCDGSSDA